MSAGGSADLVELLSALTRQLLSLLVSSSLSKVSLMLPLLPLAELLFFYPLVVLSFPLSCVEFLFSSLLFQAAHQGEGLLLLVLLGSAHLGASLLQLHSSFPMSDLHSRRSDLGSANET